MSYIRMSKMKKSSKRLIVIFSSLVFITICITVYYYWNKEEEATDDYQEPEKEITLDEQDLNNLLPTTMEVVETDTKRETIAYRLLFDLMGQYKENGLLANAFFTRFHLLDGDEQSFTVAVVFQVELGAGVQTTSWGDVEAGGLVDGLVWKLNIKKNADQIYTLQDVEKSSDRLIGLPPVEDEASYQKGMGMEPEQENNRYEIVDDTVRVTYNDGADWIDVPATVETFFEGDYVGSEDELIEGSYVITPERTAFIIGGRESIRLLQTTDQGKSWEENVIDDQLPGVRKKLLGFTSDQNGYLIVTGDRTMSSEMNRVLKTEDGGNSWHIAGGVEETSRLVTDGGFINDDLGFMSFGAVNVNDQPPKPSLFRTNDGGSSWEQVEVPIPDEYKGIFTVAEMPVFHEGKGTLIVNQGPDGDYVGGKVRAKFTSEDEGKTWTLASLVDPDNALGE